MKLDFSLSPQFVFCDILYSRKAIVCFYYVTSEIDFSAKKRRVIDQIQGIAKFTGRQLDGHTGIPVGSGRAWTDKQVCARIERLFEACRRRREVASDYIAADPHAFAPDRIPGIRNCKSSRDIRTSRILSSYNVFSLSQVLAVST